ncbi:MAG: ABC transporter permease [Mariniblastus sp.]
MNVFKIAWRSIQHRGIGSFLTIVSMALGVMMVVAVLSIHGLVSQSFKSNNSFGYNVLVGARGGGLQLTLNTVYYLSQPVENIPYEYYLAFCDAETRERELKNSITYHARQNDIDSASLISGFAPGGMGLGAALGEALIDDTLNRQKSAATENKDAGLYKTYTEYAIPILLGDSYVDPETQEDFRCVGTKPNFFTDLVLDIDTEDKFEFAEGRCFVEDSPENGFFECVVGARVAKRCDIKLGDRLQATHGVPEDESSHLHEQEYVVVGIIAPTQTPHDRVVFLNMEGFYLMEDHANPVENDSALKNKNDDDEDEVSEKKSAAEPDPFDDGNWDDESESTTDESEKQTQQTQQTQKSTSKQSSNKEEKPELSEAARQANATRIPLPIEQREVTSILVRTSKKDPYGILGIFLPDQINVGDLETTLDWTPFRPERSQKAAQAVNPVMQVASLFQLFVDPIRWLLLALTCMICLVSALSILVGIYNSMSQRQHEIAVMRALGASRSKVMLIMLSEAVLLAFVGGMLGWVSGHALNAALGPVVESRTGVSIGFFDFAPPVPLAAFPGAEILPSSLAMVGISPEFLIIPCLMLLAILVGIYPAISAYRTDVSKSLGK